MSRALGFHVSIAGGLPRAVPRALDRESTALQIFCDNPRAWRVTPRSEGEIAAFLRGRKQARLVPLVVHACYLINPSAPDRSVFARSVRRLAHELKRSAEIGAEFYVLHPGSHKGRRPDWGVRRAARAISEAAERAGRLPALLLENTASPHGPGGSFELLGELIAAVHDAVPDLPVGLALDTCHAFGAGYDLRQESDVDRLVRQVDRWVGLGRAQLVHANDSRDPCGSGRDRHWHIGQGTIGGQGLANLFNHPSLSGQPIILETPWESPETDLKNIRAVRRLLAARR